MMEFQRLLHDLPASIEQQQFLSLLTLMEDPAVEVQTAVRQQFYQWGTTVIPTLRHLLPVLDPHRQQWIRGFIREYQVRALEQLQHLVVDAVDQQQGLSIEPLFFQISCFGYPETPIPYWQQYLDRLAQPGRGIGAVIERYRWIRQQLVERHGFRSVGEEEGYYPDFSYAHTVLRYRRGTSLSLSIVYLLLARRVGLDAVGINMPLRFLLYAPELDLFVDPLRERQFLSYQDCQHFIESVGISFTPAMLRPASTITMTIRILRNLVYGYNRLNRMWESSILQQCIHTILEAIEEKNE